MREYIVLRDDGAMTGFPEEVLPDNFVYADDCSWGAPQSTLNSEIYLVDDAYGFLARFQPPLSEYVERAAIAELIIALKIKSGFDHYLAD